MLKTVSTQLALASDTLPEVLAKGNTTGGTDLAVSAGDDITLADNSKVIFGAGSDLSIYSDGATGQVTGSVNVTGSVSLASDSAEVVLAANTGYYTKIGRVVTCTGAVTVSSIGTPVGNVGFDGLPFATANVTDIGAAISLYTYGWKTSMTTHVMASLSGNSSSWFVQKSNGAGTVAVLSGDVQATTYIQYTIVYQTA
jgi:hypothetical protein